MPKRDVILVDITIQHSSRQRSYIWLSVVPVVNAISYEDCTFVGVIAGSGTFVLPPSSLSSFLFRLLFFLVLFYLLHTFAEEFTSVVCDPSHRVPHPLIKDCATDVPSPTWIHLFFAPQWYWQP